MAFFKYRVDLANAIFPFESDFSGRSIIIPSIDQNYNYLDEVGEPVKDRGIPQAYYMHNVLAAPTGYQSIGYTAAISGLAGATAFDTLLPCDYISPAVARFLLSPAGGYNYVYDTNVGTWASISPFNGSVPTNVQVTTAYVNGVTYICYAGYNVFTYNQTTKHLDTVSLPALTVANIISICGALGYMIATDGVNVVWSSATTATDFVPSLVTGAGGGALQYADGKVNFIVPITNGFMCYCERNVVSAQYTGNINFPWTFKAVEGSAGCYDVEQVTWQSNTGYHYVWSLSGFQQLTPSTATWVFPEVTNFLAKLVFEDFSETTLTMTQTFLTAPLYTKVSMVAENFLVISYGVAANNFTHALVYDASLQRWGKLKIPHRKCFEWTAPNLYGNITYGSFATAQPPITYGGLGTTTYGQLAGAGLASYQKPDKSLAFLQADGTIKIVNMDLSEATADGVLIIGKYELQRNKWIIHQYTDVENIEQGNNYALYIIPTLDGKTFQPPASTVQIMSGPKVRRLGALQAGQNISHLMVGAFNLVSAILVFTVGGDR